MLQRLYAAAFVLAALLACSHGLRAQVSELPPVNTVWVRAGTDSVRMEYSAPSMTGRWPAVIVLPDRFGIGDGVRGVLKILARMGFAAYAVPTRSATVPAARGIPPVTYDSTDVDLVIDVAAAVTQRSNSNGKISLLGFDTGASAALSAAARMPFFKSCVLFYPYGGVRDLERLREVQCPVLLNLSQTGSDITTQDVAAVKDTLIDAGKIVRIRYYKESSVFFFNPEHENYHKKNTQAAWNELISYYRNTFQGSGRRP